MAISNTDQTLEPPIEGKAVKKKSAGLGFDWQTIVASPAFIPGALVFAGIVLLFWQMMKFLPDLWMSEDGYYSHGFLVPFISGYIIYKNWDKLKDRAVKPVWIASVPLVICMYLALIAARTDMYAIASVALLGTLWCSMLMVAGWQWLKGTFLVIGYLIFALPIWSMAIEIYTNPLQQASTQVAYQLLNLMGFNPYFGDPSTIHLSQFTLNIAVPCSGLKLLLALTAFTTFFMLVANLKLMGNLVMVVLVLPLALFINGLRIALIGVVGNMYGHDAGMQFHDYSGYLTLIVCFFILFRIARGLGWKD